MHSATRAQEAMASDVSSATRVQEPIEANMHSADRVQEPIEANMHSADRVLEPITPAYPEIEERPDRRASPNSTFPRNSPERRLTL